MKQLTITVAEFSRLVGIGKTKIYELISEGEIEVVRIGRRTLITVESAESLIERSRTRNEQ